MRGSIIVIGAVVALLLVGLFFTASGVPLPQTRQLENPEGSTLEATSDQGFLLAVLLLGVPAIIVGMALPLYGGVWFLNREVRRAEEQENQPLELLQLGSASVPTASVLAKNSFAIVLGLGLVMVAIVVVILLATSL